MAYVLRELGDWDEAQELCADLIAPGAPPQDTLVADGVLGAIEAWRGRGRRGRAADALPRDVGAAERRLDAVRQRGGAGLARRAGGRRAAGRGALPHRPRPLGAQPGPPLRRLGPALGGGLARGRPAAWRWRGRAPRRSRRSPRRPGTTTRSRRWPARSPRPRSPRATPTPRSRSSPAPPSCTPACTSRSSARRSCVRGAAALAATGERDAALDQLAEAHRTATALGARPLAAEAASAVAALGASIADHLGRRAAAEHETAGLSRREVEVVRLVARGLTNREIAAAARAQHAHRGHARPQHPDQAAQPHPHRGRRAGRRARAARSRGPVTARTS